jgi:cell division septation protein DedD
VTSSVKERLTGALILIVALVIIVPELFSGRPEQRPATDAPAAQSADAGAPLRSYTMDLGAGQAGKATKAPEPEHAAPEVKQAADAAPAPAPAPEVASTTVIPEPKLPPASKPIESSKTAVEATVKPPTTKPATTAQAHGWWVQLGSFSARANADRLAATLGSAGYSVRVSPTTKNGKELYRVLAGPADDRAAAVTLQARLTAAGHKGALVAP